MGVMQMLEGALRKGNVIHAFLSGGRLRVVRVEKGRHGDLTGYGEHPNIEDALKHAAEDYAAGGRDYKKVYGEKGLYPHYLTGSSSASSALDDLFCKGGTFDARAEKDTFVVELMGYGKTRNKEVEERVCKTGKTEQWENRGFTYETSASRFPNGEPCCSTRVVKSPEGKSASGRDPWMYDTVQIGQAASLEEAFALALKAASVETSKSPHE